MMNSTLSTFLRIDSLTIYIEAVSDFHPLFHSHHTRATAKLSARVQHARIHADFHVHVRYLTLLATFVDVS